MATGHIGKLSNHEKVFNIITCICHNGLCKLYEQAASFKYR